MIAKLLPNRVRRMYLGGGRIDSFTGVKADEADGVPRPEDWLASTTAAFNGSREVADEGFGHLSDGRLVSEVAGQLPILVKLLDSEERLVIQAHPTIPCANRLFGSHVGKTECWYFLPGTADDPTPFASAWRNSETAPDARHGTLYQVSVLRPSCCSRRERR